MKKILLLIIGISISTFLAGHNSFYNLKISSNDSLIIYDSEMNVVNNQTVKSFSNSLTDLQVVKFKVKNTTSTDLNNFYVKKIVEHSVPNASFSICDRYTCYPPFIDITRNVDTISIGELEEHIQLDYMPGGSSGTSRIELLFFDSLTNSYPVTARVFVELTTSGLSIDNDFKTVLNGPIPNPATDKISFNHSFASDVKDAKLIIRNMLGQQVITKNIDITSQKTILNVSDLSSGVYFCTFIVDGNILSSKKLIIK